MYASLCPYIRNEDRIEFDCKIASNIWLHIKNNVISTDEFALLK